MVLYKNVEFSSFHFVLIIYFKHILLSITNAYYLIFFFYQVKLESNDLNVYNQNFKGLYCICHRPYPDEENTDEMIQCIVCEDWFHSKVLFFHLFLN